jgi:hypothetical protein
VLPVKSLDTQIVGVDVLAGQNRLAGKADHLAVATYWLIGRDLPQCYFVATRDRLAHGDLRVGVFQGGVYL